MEHHLDSDEKEHAFTLVQKLDTMRKTGQDCDLVIKVESEEIPVHRNVMRAQSDYFDAMFTHDTLEKQSGVVEMKTVKFEPVKKCVDFFYTGKIFTSEEGCEELLYTSSLIQAETICEKVVSLLQSLLNTKSFFKTRKIAIKYSLENLSKVCDEFALETLDSVVHEEEFNELEEEYVSFLITTKKSSNVHSEDSKLAIVIQWIKYDIANRQKQLEPMMKLLDLTKVSSGTFKYLVENEPLVNQSIKLMTRFVLAGMEQSDVMSRPLKISFPPSREPNAIVVFDLSSKSLQAYYPATKSWRKLGSLIDEMYGSVKFSAAVINTFLYVIMADGKVYHKDLSNQSSRWVGMKNTRKNHGQFLSVAAHKDFLYVAGKHSVERWQEGGNEWEEITPGGRSFEECSFVGHGNCIYSFGGRNRTSDILKLASKLCHTSLLFSQTKPLDLETTAPASSVHNNKIIVAGGMGTPSKYMSDVQCYDPEADSWAKLGKMNKSHCCFGLCVVNGKLFAVGHFEYPCTIEEYDVENDVWRIVSEDETMKIMARATVAAYVPE